MNLPTWLTDNSSENAESTGGLERLLVSGLQEASLPVAISQSEALRDREPAKSQRLCDQPKAGTA